jgi:hypothetical protein
MKLIELLPPVIKSIVGVVAFLVGLGWAAYSSVYLIVKAEGKVIKEEVREIRNVDMQHLDKRFDRLESLIQER